MSRLGIYRGLCYTNRNSGVNMNLIFLNGVWRRRLQRLALAALGLALVPGARAQVPKFISQPVDQFIGTGQAVTFTATATGGTPIFFQWKRNGNPIPGATNVGLTSPADTAFSIQPAGPTDAGTYSVVAWNDFSAVGNAFGAADSFPAQLVITNLPPLPAGNDFAARGDLGGNIFFGSRGGNNLSASNEPGEPPHGGVPGGASVWVKWKPLQSGIAMFDTMGSGFDTTLGIYTLAAGGQGVSNLVLVARDEDSGGFYNSRIFFNVVANTEYEIAIDGFYAERGNIVLNWGLEVTTDHLPEIIQQPGSQTVPPNVPVEFLVTVSPNTPTTAEYAWFLNGKQMAGQTASNLVINPATAKDMVGEYVCRVRVVGNFNRDTFSEPAQLQIGFRKSGITDPDVRSAGKFRAESDLAGGPLPSGIHLHAVAPAGGYSGTQIFATAPGKEVGEPNHCGEAGGASFWFTYQPPLGGLLTVDSIGTTFNNVIAIYTGPGDSYATLVPVGCSSTNSGNGNEVATFSCMAGTNYYVVSDGVGGAVGTVNLNYSLAAPPVVGSVLPVSKIVNVTSNATFAVSASGTPPLRYQWLLNVTNVLANATNASLLLTNCQPANAGSYTVVVTNDAGTATSPAATLTVLVPPVITNQPVDLTVIAGSNATFAVLAGGTLPLSYRWLFNTNQNLSGATNASYTVTNAQPANAGQYNVVITNVAGAVVSSFATLTVNVPPTITNQPQSQTVVLGSNATLTVGASGTTPLAYQWRTNGSAYAGQTNNPLNVLNFQPANEGGYDVVVTNVAGAVTSSTALLYYLTSNNAVRFTNMAWVTNRFTSLLLGATNTNYIVQTSTNLTNWSALSTNASGGGIINFAHTNATDSNLFYRARTP